MIMALILPTRVFVYYECFFVFARDLTCLPSEILDFESTNHKPLSWESPNGITPIHANIALELPTTTMGDAPADDDLTRSVIVCTSDEDPSFMKMRDHGSFTVVEKATDAEVMDDADWEIDAKGTSPWGW